MVSRQFRIAFTVLLLFWCCDLSAEDTSIGRLLSRRVREVTESEKQDMFEKLVRQGSRLRTSAVIVDAVEVSMTPSASTEESAVIVEVTTLSGTNELTEDAVQREGEQLHQTAPLRDDTAVQNPKKVPKRKHDRRHAGKKDNQSKNNNKKQRQHRQGRHVCTHEETVSRPVRVVESYCKPAYKSFTQRCANGTLCTAFRVQYETIYRTTVKYQMVTERKHACCPGWTHTTKHTHGCTQPVCSKGCKYGGTCIKPDVCQCLPGYTGPSCETDIDECSNNQYNKCTQSCNNTPGSYQCTCHQGFQLQEDGRSCKFQLESVPELQELLRNYESMAQRLTQLEQETHERAVPATESSAAVTQSPSSAAEGSAEPSIETVDKSEYESTIARLMQQIFTLEDKVQKLNEFNIYLNNTRSMSDLPSDSLSSLSEQVAILEERLADCTCKP